MRPSDQDVYDLLERVMAFCIAIENEHDALKADVQEASETDIQFVLKGGAFCSIEKLVDDAISIRVDASDMSRDIAGHSSM